MKTIIHWSSVVCLLFSWFTGSDVFSSDRAPEPGMEQLYRLDGLAMMKESVEVGAITTYDRTGGNNDGFNGTYSFVRKEKGGLVLADLKGPGVMYRFHTPTPTDDILEFYFDGETEPRIRLKYRDMFTGTHPPFERPLVGCGAGGFFCYVPIPYEKSLKIFLKAGRTRFHDLNYARYPKTAAIKSYSPEPTQEYRRHLEKAKQLLASYGSDISSYITPPGGRVSTMHSALTLEPGKKAIIFDKKQPGRIVGIRLLPADAFCGKERDVVIRAFWDGDKQPAILAPAGDFFGYAWGSPAMKSLMIGTADGVNYCYFPMPFDKSARIELQAEPSRKKKTQIEAQVLFVPMARKQNEGKFYAVWRRENPTTKGKPFTFLDTKGRGHMVGCIQQSQGRTPGTTYFFEGDDQTTIDGKLAIHGTGTEDFYNGGWYDVAGRWETQRSFALSGCLGYIKPLARTGGYRLFIGDAYAYRQSLLHTIEHAPTKNDDINDYCGMTFFYSLDRPTCEFALPPVADRMVTDPEKIVFNVSWNVPIHAFSLRNASLTKAREKINDKDVSYLSFQAKGRESFGLHYITFRCDLPAAGKYEVTVDAVKGPRQGIIQIFQDEMPVGPAMDLYREDRQLARGIYAGTLPLEEGPNRLMFKIIGTNEKSNTLRCDLSKITCRKVP